jgi:hypothetical protein
VTQAAPQLGCQKYREAMILHAPFEISSRLLPALHIAGAWVQIEYCGGTDDGRQRYRYTVDLPGGCEHVGQDLASGVGGGSLLLGFQCLLDFLSAAGESYGYHQRTGEPGENEDLFPPAVAEWAWQNSDELDLTRLEITEMDQPLIEERQP